MFIYKFPHKTEADIGQFILVGSNKDKALVYSITNGTFPRFYFVFNSVCRQRNIVNSTSEIKEKQYLNDIKLAYNTFQIVMTRSIGHLDPNSEKYCNIVEIRNNYVNKCLYEACVNFIEGKNNDDISDLITKLEAQSI